MSDNTMKIKFRMVVTGEYEINLDDYMDSGLESKEEVIENENHYIKANPLVALNDGPIMVEELTLEKETTNEEN